MPRACGIAGLAAAAHSLAAFTDADRVHVGRVTPASMRGAVTRAIRAGQLDQ